jgi:hypothetical protein
VITCLEELADEKQVVGVAAQGKWLVVAWKTILEYCDKLVFRSLV